MNSAESSDSGRIGVVDLPRNRGQQMFEQRPRSLACHTWTGAVPAFRIPQSVVPDDSRREPVLVVLRSATRRRASTGSRFIWRGSGRNIRPPGPQRGGKDNLPADAEYSAQIDGRPGGNRWL